MSETAAPMQVDGEPTERPIQRRYVRQRQALHDALALIEARKFEEALRMLRTLLSEASKFDDKALIVEVHLMTARTWHAMGNPQKAMSSVVAARTGSAGMFLSGPVNAELEHTAALTNAADGDYSTAFSYWYEALQAYLPLTEASAIAALSGKSIEVPEMPEPDALSPTLPPPTTATTATATTATATTTTDPSSAPTFATSAVAAIHSAAAGATVKSVFGATKRQFAVRALVTCVYLVLCKLMGDSVRDLPKLFAASDVGQFAATPPLRSMMAVVAAYKERDLHALHAIIATHSTFAKLPATSASMAADSSYVSAASPTGAAAVTSGSPGTTPPTVSIAEDPMNEMATVAVAEVAEMLARDGIFAQHIGALEEKLLERHVERLAAPYQRVQLSYLASRVGVSQAVLERKAALMILDGTLHGVIQQTPSGAFLVRTIAPPSGRPIYSMLRPAVATVCGAPYGSKVPLGVKADVVPGRLQAVATLDRDKEEVAEDAAADSETAFYERALPALDALSQVVDALAERHAREMRRFPLGIRTLVHNAARRGGVDAVGE